jgi:3-isopropylmalate/(R)-2-methylmalate dehydratase small subunit
MAMQRFEKLTGVAAPMGIPNVDTDAIIPKQYLKTIKRAGLGKGLFSERRYNENGEERPDFVLNQGPFRKATILVAGENFGCGSSREHAPWALLDFGIRCIIAPSFADIFHNNMFKNGMLPVRLNAARVHELIQFLTELPGAEITVDLREQTVTGPDEQVDHFDVAEFSRECLLNGYDDIELSLLQKDKIDAYEKRKSVERPWL